jgi:NADPH:quinone reductase-like Zn-dependent oxidoreductase
MPDEGTTREVFFARTGTDRVISLRERALPSPGPGEVQVRMEAAGVAYADIVIRLGLYPDAKPPLVPGYDLVGRVEKVGDGVTALKAGQRVAGVTVTGAQASLCNMPAEWLIPAPEGVEAALLVAGVLNGVTAFQMFHRLACPEAGEWVLVHGAGGGVGNLLLGLGRIARVQVIGTGSASKLAAIEAAGAAALDYGRGNVAQMAREISDGGVVAAFDHVGGRHFRQVSMAALRPGGAGILYGGYGATQGGRVRPLAALDILLNDKFSAFKLFGSSQGVLTYSAPRWRTHRPDAFRQDLASVLALITEGELTPLIGARFPLEQAAEAHRLLEARAVSGKIVLINANP